MLKFSGFADLTSCLGEKSNAHRQCSATELASAHSLQQLMKHREVFSKLLARAANAHFTHQGCSHHQRRKHPLMRRDAQLAMLEPPHEMVKQSSGMRKE